MRLGELASYAFDFVFPPRDTARIVRLSCEEDVLTLLTPRLASGTITLLPYRHRLVRALIIEAKFNRNQKAINLLGLVLKEYLATAREEATPFGYEEPVIVAVPLGRRRRRERGYNQVELVAQAAGVDTRALLVRKRDTTPQTSLSRRARRMNMEGAFEAAGPIDENRTYIVLDDVQTTGATLTAAVSTLRRAGVTCIQALALAH